MNPHRPSDLENLRRQEPKPSDFGLSEEALRRCRGQWERESLAFGLLLLLGFLIGAAALYPRDVWVLPGWLVGGIAGTLVGVFAFIALFALIFAASRAESTQYDAYRAARKEWLPKVEAARVKLQRREADRRAAEENRKRRKRAHWLQLSGHEFEQELAAVLRRHPAYSDVALTAGSSDGGVDLYAKRGGKTIVIQCKNYSKPAGPRPVRELKGVLRRGEQGVLVASSGVTQSAAAEARRRRVEVWDVDDVLRLAAGAGAGRPGDS